MPPFSKHLTPAQLVILEKKTVRQVLCSKNTLLESLQYFLGTQVIAFHISSHNYFHSWQIVLQTSLVKTKLELDNHHNVSSCRSARIQ
jgi:hypothetical protein